MRKSRFSVEQIVAAIKQTEMGMPVADLCRKLGVSEPTYYRWKKMYGSLEPDQALKLNKSKAYPTTDELLEFGKNHCRVGRPHEILERIAEGMSKAVISSDERIPAETKRAMLEFWKVGQAYAMEAARKTRPPSKRKPR